MRRLLPLLLLSSPAWAQSSDVTSIGAGDLAAYLGYLFGAWGVGFAVGSQWRAIKQFFESSL